MPKVVIFGVRDFSQLAYYYLRHDSPHEVVAFSVNRSYLPEGGMFLGLPVVAFEEVQDSHPPSEYMFFAPMSPRNMNRDREHIYRAIKEKGYGCISYVSGRATVFGNEIGENCFILEGVNIQPFASIGNNVVLWSGSQISHHSIVSDHVTLTSHVVISGHCDIGSYSFFGANSTLRDGLRIAEGTFVAMATAVVHDTEGWSAYKGNPAVKLNIPSTKMKM